MALRLQLQVVRTGQAPCEYQFSSDTHRAIKVGKLNSAQVKLEDPAASRIHAVIELAPTQVVLVDMGTAAGTYVNGQRVHKAQLATDDIVTIGETSLIVGVQVEASAAVSAPATPVGAPAPGPAAAATAMAMGMASAAPGMVMGQGNSGYMTASAAHGPAPATSPASPAVVAAPAPTGVASPVTAAVAPLQGPGLGGAIPAPASSPLPQVATPLPTAASHPRLMSALATLSAERIALVEAFASFLSTYPGRLPRPETWGADGRRVGALAREKESEEADPLRRDARRRLGLAIAATLALIVLAALVAVLWQKGSSGTPPTTAPSSASAAVPGGAPPTAPAPPASASTSSAPTAAAAPGPAPTTAPPTPAPAPAAARAAASPPRAADMTYLRVAAGQSLDLIANTLWGNTTNAAFLLEHNPEARTTATPIAPGTVIKIPSFRAYTVVSGDTLGDIAGRMLGDERLYEQIFKVNQSLLPDPEAVEVGMLLKIPLINDKTRTRLTALGEVLAH